MKLKHYIPVVVASVVYLLTMTMVVAQPLEHSFPFTISTSDTVSATKLPTTLGEAPIVSRIKAENGHFVIKVGSQSQRIRLFGTELWFDAQFIDRDHCKQLAAHLHKLGFNALRLTINDYPYWSAASLCTADASGSYAINRPNFNKFDTLLYELKQQGIYVFLTLHSYHYFTAADGVAQPDTVGSLSQFVHFIDKRAAELHRQWAKTLLGHVNPLTGARLADDPAIVAIEIAGNQELSLLCGWRNAYLNWKDNASVAVSGSGGTVGWNRSRRLDTLFSQYLLKKYGSNAGINTAWGGAPITNPVNLIDNGSFEQVGSAAWSFSLNNGATGDKSLFGTAADSQFCMLLLLSRLSAKPTWNDAYLVNSTLKLKKDSLYELKYWAKIYRGSSSPAVLSRSLTTYIYNANDYSVSLSKAGTIDTSWKQYSITFRSLSDGVQYLIFGIGDQLGDVMIDGVTVKRVPEVGLTAGESAQTYSIARAPFGATKLLPFQRFRDMFLFYDSLQQDYFNAVKACIRDTIKSDILINNYSPMYWGTYTEGFENRGADYTGGGNNIDYPRSADPAKAYTDSTWVIGNNSLVKMTGNYTLGVAMSHSVDGKPFIFSSFLQPFMNQHSMGIAPFIASYGSLQDWDGIFLTPYAYYAADLDSDYSRKEEWWAIKGNASMMASIPSASAMFRSFKTATTDVGVTIAHDNDDVQLWGMEGHFSHPFGVEGYLNPNIAAIYRIRNSYGAAKHKIASEYPYLNQNDSITKVSDNEQIQWNQTRGWETVNTLKYQGACGIFSGDTITLNTFGFSRKDNGSDELSLSLQSVDTSDISKSPELFLTLGTRSQNTGWLWYKDSSIRNHWGTGPTLMKAASVECFIRCDSDRLVVYPLLPSGTLSENSFEGVKLTGTNIFSVKIDQQTVGTPWYFLKKEAAVINAVAPAASSSLTMRVQPNPVRDNAQVIISLPTEGNIRLSVFDELGREVTPVVTGVLSSGEHRLPLTVEALPSGHYSVRLQSRDQMITASLLISK